MTYVDFGPALRILSRCSPALASLALHGLHLPGDALLAFATACPRMRRLNLVACRYTVEALAGYLGAAHELCHLDLTAGPAAKAELLAWMAARRLNSKPVLSLVLLHCKNNNQIAQRAEMDKLDYELKLGRPIRAQSYLPPLITIEGERRSLFDAVLLEATERVDDPPYPDELVFIGEGARS